MIWYSNRMMSSPKYHQSRQSMTNHHLFEIFLNVLQVLVIRVDKKWEGNKHKQKWKLKSRRKVIEWKNSIIEWKQEKERK